MSITVKSLFESSALEAFSIFDGVTYPWDVLSKLKAFLLEYAQTLSSEYEQVDEFVWVGKGTHIEKSVLIKGPAIIGRDCELRHSAYIRENVLIGNNVVIGNSTEVKNSIIFDNAQAPHFNYVGDSIMGYKAHIGAGVILSNLKSTGGTVSVKYNDEHIETGLRKFGAILGDHAEVGCNSVLNPGTVIGKNSVVYPLSSVRGYIPENSIYKDSGEIAAKK